jgi:hypothetical protein
VAKVVNSACFNARMAKLADALASGASGRKVVQVQVLFRALGTKMPPVVWVAFLSSMFEFDLPTPIHILMDRRNVPVVAVFNNTPLSATGFHS